MPDHVLEDGTIGGEGVLDAVAADPLSRVAPDGTAKLVVPCSQDRLGGEIRDIPRLEEEARLARDDHLPRGRDVAETAT